MELTDLITFKDIHKGKKAFVCGSGTSLNRIPPKTSEYGITICVNASGLRFESFDYLYLTDDATPHMAYWDTVVARAKNIVLANPSLMVIGKELKEKHPEKPVFLMTRNYDDHNDYKFKDDLLCLGNDASLTACHLAYVMGCRPIILCGIDLCFDNGNRYFTPFAFEHKSNSPYKKSWDADYANPQLKNKTKGYESDIWLDIALTPWERVTQQNNLLDIVFNASDISKLPHFKKVNIEDYLK